MIILQFLCVEEKREDSLAFVPALTYPALEMDESLSDNQKKNLEIKLKKESENMINKFGRILTKFGKFLKKSDVDLEDLKWALQIRGAISTILKDEIEQPTVKKDLEKADSIAKIMRIICSYCSFFSYKLLFDIFDHVEYDEGEYFLKEYELDFLKYAERRVMCCPYGMKSEDTWTTKVVFALDEAFKDCKIIHISRLEDDLSQIFRIELTSFYICGVKPGSVCIAFLLPARFQERFVSLSSKQIHQLKELNYEGSEILSIVCGEHQHVIKCPKAESGNL